MLNSFILIKNEYKQHSFEDKMREIFPPSSRVLLRKDTLDVTMKGINNTKPLLTDVWLVEIEGNIGNDVLPSILTRDDVCIIYCNTKSQAEEKQKELRRRGVDTIIIDDTEQTKEDKETFVMKELKIDRILATVFCKKLGYYMPSIAENVFSLKNIHPITIEVINKYVDKSLFVSYYMILELLLDVQGLSPAKRKTNRNKVIKMLNEYPNIYKSVIKFLNKELDKYYEVFKVVYIGELHYDNLYTYKTDNDIIKEIKVSQLKRILDAFNVISFERLDFIRSNVKRLTTNPLTIHKLLYLFQ